MEIKSAVLHEVIGVTSAIPDHVIPEIALAGKSNVGKSSLINALIHRKALARVSGKPGKTATINFYFVNGAFYLVDLPGYGFTKTSASIRDDWGKMTEKYLKKSSSLLAVFLLIDMRHEPSANDLQMYDWIRHNGFLPIVVLTKSDKLSSNEKQKMLSVMKKTFPENTELFPVSSETKDGVTNLLKRIEELLNSKNTETDPV